MAIKIVIGVLFCVFTKVNSQGFFNEIFGSDLILDDRFVNFFNTPYQKTCGNIVRSRVSYFQSQNLARLANQDQTCSLTVRRLNSRINQIRVDIISMNIAPPTTINPNLPGVWSCLDDVFRVREPAEVEIPDLCGGNANNHFYIHLTPGQREVNLDMLISAADRLQVPGNVNWNMKITQLESPSIRMVFDPEKQKFENRNQIARDFQTSAPDGCLQYFTESSGTVQSFGFVTATDKTLANGQNYASCFKPYGNCGVQFRVVTFDLRNNLPADQPCGEELIIPEMNPEFDNGLCVDPVGDSAFSSSHPGPIYIHFNNLRADAGNPAMGPGFQLRYSRVTDC